MSLKLIDITQWNVGAVVLVNAVHKVVPVGVLIRKELNYFRTSLQGKIRLRLKLKKKKLISYIGMSVQYFW